MDNLYAELVAGDVSYDDKGRIITHPPTSMQLRAARAIKQLMETLNSNQPIMMQMQYRAELGETAAREFSEQLTIAKMEIEQLKKQINESLRKDQQEASNLDTGPAVGGTSDRAECSDSDNQGGAQAGDSRAGSD